MEIKIALAGNPNCGKTTLFNALTGSNQFVGNWPGVTVEKKEGHLKGHKDVIITDLPGIYSLSPYTLEEVVARNYLIDEQPDAILNIIDGTNLERNLYLTTQLVEIGIPVVVAINMMDVVRKNGDVIKTDVLAKELGCPVVEISALKNKGIDEVSKKAIEVARAKKQMIPQHKFCGCVEHAIAHIEEAVLHSYPEEKQRWYAIKIFERDEKILNKLQISDSVKNHIENDIKSAEDEMDDDSESIITNERYVYIASVIKNCYKKKNKNGLTVSDKIDKVVTNRFLALPIFALVMFIVYYVSITTVGSWCTDWTNDVLFGEWIPDAVNGFLEKINCAGWLQSLIVDGIIGGVGAVLGFVPQMLVLFIFLAFLEACGYLARIEFVMDRIFRNFGLSGKSYEIGTGMLIIYSIAAIIRMGNWAQNDTYRSAGDAAFGSIMEITFMYIMVLPFVYLSNFYFHAPFLLVFAFCYIDEPIRYIIMQCHLYSGKWIRPVSDAGLATIDEFRRRHHIEVKRQK